MVRHFVSDEITYACGASEALPYACVCTLLDSLQAKRKKELEDIVVGLIVCLKS